MEIFMVDGLLNNISQIFLINIIFMMRPPVQDDLVGSPNTKPYLDWRCVLALTLQNEPLLHEKSTTTTPKYFDLAPEHLQLAFRNQEQVYLTDGSLLTHTRITPFDREKLKSWLLSETQNLYCRETYALASRFLDMFFMQRHNVLKSEFQSLGLACLILASKIVESKIPAISFHIFNKTKILDFEQLLTRVFSFKLNPLTYITIAQTLLTYWDSYLRKDPPFCQVRYYKDNAKSIIHARALFETLDCLDLVTDSLNYRLVDLVACTFYVEHRRPCLLAFRDQAHSPAHQDTQSTVFNFSYQHTMSHFFTSLQSTIPLFHNLTLHNNLLLYILQFSRPSPRIPLRSFRKHREELMRQTYNEEISGTAQRYLRKSI